MNEHAGDLGLTGEDARRTTVRDAADLLARLSGTHDATALVRELAAGESGGDEVLAATITSADTVLSALNTVQWTLLESMRQFAGRGDEIGDRATRLLDELTTAATADEFTRQLAPVLTGLFQRAVAIVNAAAAAGRQACSAA